MDHRLVPPSEHHFGHLPGLQHEHSLPSLHHVAPPHSQNQHSFPQQSSPPPHLRRTAPSPISPYRPHSASAYGPLPPVRPERSPEHVYTGEGSGHGTPVNKHPSDFAYPPPQQTSGTPSHQHAPITMHRSSDRAPEPHHAHGYPAEPPPGYTQYHGSPAHADGGPVHHHMIEHSQYSMQHSHQPYVVLAQPPPHDPLAKGGKKSHRATQACDSCRGRKSKCSEERPTCKLCKDNGIECVYRESNPTKPTERGGPAMNEVLDALQRMPQLVVGELAARLEHIEHLLSGNRRQPKSDDSFRRDSPLSDTTTPKFESCMEPTAHSVKSSQGSKPKQDLLAPQDGALDVPQQTTTKAPDEVPGFEEHTTAAHKLLYLWPDIYKLLQDKDHDFAFKHNYVLHGEARGWLRLDGVGEAEKPTDLGTPDFLNQLDSYNTEPIDSPQIPFDVWANPTPSDGTGHAGLLDLSAPTVERLLHNYKVHIHKLHPFLDMATLERFISGFVHRAGSPGPYGNRASSFMAVNGDNSRPNKRKRSLLDSHSQSVFSLYRNSGVSHERTLPVAITYLVLALGQAVEYQDMMPGPIPDDTAAMLPPPNQHGDSPSATSRPSPISTFAGGQASTPLSETGSVGYSARPHDSPAPALNRGRTNSDVIPGLKYYTEACLILGLFTDSNELALAQARLLGGLYKGQLGRVQESWSWICDAGRVCRYQIRMHGLDQGTTLTHQWKHALGSPRDVNENSILFSCWSALQLESDILAELDYPHSGLADVQDKIPYPRQMVGDESFQQMYNPQRTPMYYYAFLLYLRKRLNEMHANIYAKNLPSSPPQSMAKTLIYNEDYLESMRTIHGWNDDEDGPADILEARLRAKFYGARYICLRPYLDYVLHAMDQVKAGEPLSKIVVDAYDRPRRNEAKLFAAIATMDEEEVKSRAVRCVQAAIKSTVAFDNVPGRLIVTNIMGTGHAQFSNILVLAAAYNSRHEFIKNLIGRKQLEYLLQRTIKFLAQLRKCSRTAKVDIQILQAIHEKLFYTRFTAPELGTSFPVDTWP